ncbi:type VI secretion system baseplate subunit TssG [Puniceibacterium sp. IMCC21224]|uniref:type VI secretion system baseplate subunit TssG n=1 Tax=Puniceibacterium sp. IMCC21224 TaxID=1618204 RepID=UPI00065CD32B|nr:type VI secretion system baseplate subunit TssG [Puniceibacterium sp. IMCC21224]KMK65232.1 type VI secretion protein, VC_A0111 family [Puniceibacterium sp. IMCC21224]
MADDSGHTRADLTSPEGIARMDFFELLRQLETADLRFGRAGGADREPARLGQTARMAFAASDVAEMTPGNAEHPPKIGVNVLGLIGPEGPMPLHMTRWIMERLSNRWFAGDAQQGATADTSFLDFINMLQHRLIALYWRAWADARPEVHIAHGDGGRVTAMMRSLAGLGLPGTTTDDIRLDGAKLRHATSLALEARSPERLTAFLETVLGVPVALGEFQGVWIDIPQHLQSRLGMQHAGLGSGAVIGGRVFDRQSHAELRLGPLTLAQFNAFLDDSIARDRLRQALVFAAGKDIAFGLRLVLAADAVPQARLGACQLGRTTWLNPDPDRNADDLAFANVTEPSHSLTPAQRSAA